MSNCAHSTWRSWLFTPATRPAAFSKAGEVGADVLLIDLEDGVAAPDKGRAREAALLHLMKPRSMPVAIRINPLGTRAGLNDVSSLLDLEAFPDAIMISKAEAASQIAQLDQLLTSARKPTSLVALVESIAGLKQADAIAASSSRLSALMFGGGDMSADLGATMEWEPMLLARSTIVAAPADAGIVAVDTPYTDYGNAEGLAAEATRARALGFGAKAAIHPSQVAAINAAFSPDPSEVAWARQVVHAAEGGVGVVDGAMVDEAIARRARRTLERAGEQNTSENVQGEER